MLLPWLVETCMLCWKAAIEEARMFTLDGIDTQFTSKWTGLDIVKEDYRLFFKQCKLPLRKIPIFTEFPGVKILWKGLVSVEFRVNCPKLYGKCTFPQNFYNKKLRKNLVFYAVFSF